MLFGIQILILLFGLVMIYFTFLYYKRANYEKGSLILWLLVWIGFMFLAAFPQTVYGVMQALAIERTADFFYAGGILFITVLIFYLFNVTKQTQKKMEMLVRKIAIKRAETPKKRTTGKK